MPGLCLHQPPGGSEDAAAASGGTAGTGHLPSALPGLCGLCRRGGSCRWAVRAAEGAGCRPSLPGPHEWRPLLLLQPGVPGRPQPATRRHRGCGSCGGGIGSLCGEPCLPGECTVSICPLPCDPVCMGRQPPGLASKEQMGWGRLGGAAPQNIPTQAAWNLPLGPGHQGLALILTPLGAPPHQS